MATEPIDELLDVFDEDGSWVRTATRREVHELGLWHRTFHCLVVCERDGVPTAVMQRRHPKKSAFPGRLDISAAGHLEAGEEPIDGIREFSEELGVTPDPTQLVSVGVRRMVDLETGEGKNREQIHAFLLDDDRPVAAYRPDPIELAGVYDVPLAGLQDLLARRVDSIDVAGIVHDEAGGLTPHTWRVTVDDLIVDDSNYFPGLVALALRHLDGERGLTI